MLKQVWDKQAEDWQKNLFYSKEGILFKWLKKIAKKQDKILDQGCGVGQIALTLYQLGFKNITGMDFSSKLLKKARQNANHLGYKIKFVKGDIRKMPFPDSSFDIIISAGIVEHVPETQKTIRELSRILKKSGYLLIHIPHKISPFTLTKIAQQFLRRWKSGYEKSFTKKQFARLLQQNGFGIENYYLTPYKPGKHKILGGILSLLDKPFYFLGLGGHHMFFLCRKVT